MKKAFHPIRDERITVQQYLSEFGSKLGPHGKHRERLPSRCPACLARMKIVGEDRPPHDQVFSHIGNENPAPCPLRNSADHKYEFFQDAPQDSETGKTLRRNFFKNWEKHYAKMRKLLNGFMDLRDFIALIREADRTRLWNRSRLSEWEIPYIFLVWKEWSPVSDKTGKVLRKEWIRFWFDSRVRTIDDIWIRTKGSTFRIIKAWYTPPKRRRVPSLDHLVDTDDIVIDPNFLTSPHTQPHEYVIKKMKRNFPDEFTSSGSP